MPKKTDIEEKNTNTKDGAESTGRERKIFTVAIAVFIVAAIAAGVIFHTASSAEKEPGPVSETAGETTAAATDETEITTQAAGTTQAPTSAGTEAQTGGEETAASKTTKQAKGYSLPLSINQALNALEEHYGGGYKINSTIEDGGYNYFAIYENGEKYASVKVNLATGEATETLTANNQSTDFYLV